MKQRFLVIAAIAVAAVFLTGMGCEKVQMKPEDGEAAKPAPREIPAPTPMTGTVATIVITGANGVVPFSVEIAETNEERAKGLMNRESLPENNGMWFVFPETGSERFWMKDTKIPLDMIFVDEGMKVVHVIENAVPESEELLSSPAPYRYVLEINGGSAARRGIKAGDSVEKRVGPQ